MKYVLIHTVDQSDKHSTEGMPTFQSWLEEMPARGVTPTARIGIIEVRPIRGPSRASPEEAS